MTIQECYEQMQENYSEVNERLGNDAIIKRFVCNFLKDPSFQTLKEGLEEKDGEKAFRAAHTLKGVCLNLGFTKLNKCSSELTEKLRGYDVRDTEKMFEMVRKEYNVVTDAIRQMEEDG